MNIRKLAGDTAFAFLSQGVAFLASFAMSLLVPKFLGVTEFGYWQLFIFYASYVGFFGLGSIDGLYLSIGGTRRADADKKDIASQLLLSTGMVFIFSCGLAALSGFVVDDGKRAEAICFTAAYAVLSHLAGSFGLIFQAMNETRLYSFSVIVDRVLFLVPLFVLLALRVDVFEPYAVAYICSKAFALAFCIAYGRDIVSTGLLPFVEGVKHMASSIKIGFSLMVAGVADMLILGAARALVDFAWGIETFGKVSFALSLVNFFIAFVSQASMVLFPALRQGSDCERRRFYEALKGVAEIVFPAAYLLYLPAVCVLGVWLPQYAESMRYFAVLLPVCVFNAKMDISCTTYFKVLREERILLRVNLATVAASAALSFAGVYLFGSLDAVLLGVVACLVGRSLWCERYLDKVLTVPSSPLVLEEVLLTAVFVVSSLLLPPVSSFFLYAGAYGAYLFLNRRIALSLLGSARRASRKQRPDLFDNSSNWRR